MNKQQLKLAEKYNQNYSIDEIIKLLEDKDQQLAKLENLLKRQVGCSNCKYKEELEKEQISEMQEHQNAMKLADKRIKELEEENTSLKSELHCKVDYIHEIVNVKDDYKKQLNELPKKICDEIIHKVKNELYENEDIKYDYEYVLTLFYLKNIFKEIQANCESIIKKGD